MFTLAWVLLIVSLIPGFLIMLATIRLYNFIIIYAEKNNRTFPYILKILLSLFLACISSFIAFNLSGYLNIYLVHLVFSN